ncbi:MAG: M15 family metallopeptidase [Gallionellaceae bacterium]|jgi:D-alanyl-D-alanine dipeptidase
MRLIIEICYVTFFTLGLGFFANLKAESMVIPLVSLLDTDESIIIEMRYFSDFNFTSQRVPGYEANKCLLVKDAAKALSEVQHDLLKQGFSLKVYDCYRPQMAVDYFMRWAADASESSMKQTFYPDENKSDLVGKGYIAERSGHTRGDSIDLTLVRLPANAQPAFVKINQQKCTAPVAQRFADNSVDMGTGYDCFDSRSHTMSPVIQGVAHANRVLLEQVMARHGFSNYKKEWWHYTYIRPYGPKQFYNFSIK